MKIEYSSVKVLAYTGAFRRYVYRQKGRRATKGGRSRVG